MGKPTVVVLAAGMGSRFGGNKQTAVVGLKDEYIIDYSLYDAWKAGFGKAVLIIRPEMEADMREHFGDRLEGKMELVYAFQEHSFPYPEIQNKIDRPKPWGTSHAILCLDGIVNEPFAVINADDYYGPSSMQVVADFLNNKVTEDLQAMVGFEIGNTVPDRGTVNRGVCRVDGSSFLEYIEESKAQKTDGTSQVSVDGGESWKNVEHNTPVSMNLWGYHPSVITWLKDEFKDFLANTPVPEKDEYLLPTSIYEWIQAGRIKVEVLPCQEKWLGMTYREDLEIVQKEMAAKIAAGVYPLALWA